MGGKGASFLQATTRELTGVFLTYVLTAETYLRAGCNVCAINCCNVCAEASSSVNTSRAYQRLTKRSKTVQDKNAETVEEIVSATAPAPVNAVAVLASLAPTQAIQASNAADALKVYVCPHSLFDLFMSPSRIPPGHCYVDQVLAVG
jgi:hypothetical protein